MFFAIQKFLALAFLLSIARSAQAQTTLFTSHDKSTVALILSVGKKGHESAESRIEIRNVEGRTLRWKSFVSRDGAHGMGVNHAEWTLDDNFFVFNADSSGGHQPWRSATYFYNRKVNRFFCLGDFIGPVTSDFELIGRSLLKTTRFNFKTQVEHESVSVNLSKLTSQARFPVAKNGKWGYIDAAGKIIIPTRYDGAGAFREGLARVTLNGKTVFIDTSGRTIISPQYDIVGDFSEDLAPVNVGEKRDPRIGLIQDPGKWGYIDKSGRLVLPLRFTKADAFSEGLAAVKDDKRSGFIDHTGKLVIETSFDVSWGFHEGFALVKSNLKMRYIDRLGRILQTSALDDNYYGRDFSEGLAAVKINDKWGYIDRQGKLVIEPRFLEAWNFSEGLAAVETPVDQRLEQPCRAPGDSTSSYTVSKKYGYIDKTGKMTIQPRFESAGPFVDGLANVSNCYEAGFINKTGELVISTQYQTAAPFSGGLSAVETGDSRGLRKGYIDRSGNVIWQPSN